jgi:hypothetical protein
VYQTSSLGRTDGSAKLELGKAGARRPSGVFDPATDGIDFWESLEGMRVQLDDAVRNTLAWAEGYGSPPCGLASIERPASAWSPTPSS